MKADLDSSRKEADKLRQSLSETAQNMTRISQDYAET